MFSKDSYRDDEKLFPDICGSRNLYDHLDKFNKVKTSNQMSETSHNSIAKNDFTVSTCNQFQDINDKFQELESKMFQVEKCFKEANKRKTSELERLMDRSDTKSPAESFRTSPTSHLFTVTESRRDLNASDGIREWCGNHTKKIFQNKNVTDGSGDIPQLTNDESSKKVVKSIERLPHYKQNRKSLFTLSEYHEELPHEPSTDFICGEPNDVEFLEKSKKLILNLIDKELKKIESKSGQFLQLNSNRASRKLENPCDINKDLKIECIQNIERELKTLKKLESLE